MVKVKLIVTLLLSLMVVSTAYSATDPDKTLFVVGSTSAGRLFDIIEQPFYQKTGYKLIVRAIGSDKGVVSVAEQVSDVGIISRYLTPSEQSQFPQLSQITIAQDAIVFITNEENKQKSLRHQDIVNMYTSNAPVWPSTGETAVLLSKDLGHGTHDSFKDYFSLDSAYSADGSGIIYKHAGVNFLYSKRGALPFDRINQAIAYTSRQSNVLAYESMGAFKHFVASEQQFRSKLLHFEGVPAIKDNKVNRDYPVKRPFNILINNKRTAGVQALLAYLQSKEASALIEQNYFIPIT